MAEETKQAPAEEDAWTVMRLLSWTTDFFRKRGSDSPRLDAEVLLAHARGCARIELYTAFDTQPSEEQREAFREMVRRRGDGAPVAYLVGYREFYSLRIRVNEAVLIPRPETEHVVIEALDQAKRLIAENSERELHIVDVGTGSGAIAIGIAKHLPAASFTAIDLSAEALEIAKWNAEQHGLTERITFLQGNLLAPIPKDRSVDIIVSNPPYVSEAEYEQLAPTVREYEPKSALVSGPRGTELIERLLNEAADRLSSGGQLIIELSPMIADECASLASQSEHYDEPKFVKDFAGLRRVMTLRRH
ncbi:MAG: peptide chain release factor N(5)-glutamine methyltransferase [Planctomycetaceae bacterium]